MSSAVMSSPAPLAGQVALVTGASRGIGRAIALELAAAGAQVVVNYASSLDAATAVVAEITAAGGEAWSHRADVADEEQVDAMVKAVLAKGGRLDVLVNNAGITRDGLLMRMKTADWQSVINLNQVVACQGTPQCILSCAVSRLPGSSLGLRYRSHFVITRLTSMRRGGWRMTSRRLFCSRQGFYSAERHVRLCRLFVASSIFAGKWGYVSPPLPPPVPHFCSFRAC